MELAEGLQIIFNIISSIVNILVGTNLFGIPIAVYIVGAFVARLVMTGVFDLESSSKSTREKSRGEEK